MVFDVDIAFVVTIEYMYRSYSYQYSNQTEPCVQTCCPYFIVPLLRPLSRSLSVSHSSFPDFLSLCMRSANFSTFFAFTFSIFLTRQRVLNIARSLFLSVSIFCACVCFHMLGGANCVSSWAKIRVQNGKSTGSFAMQMGLNLCWTEMCESNECLNVWCFVVFLSLGTDPNILPTP